MDGQLEPVPGEQATLAVIAGLREAGLSLRAIADQLNGEGRRRRDGGVWRSEQVRRALRAPYRLTVKDPAGWFQDHACGG